MCGGTWPPNRGEPLTRTDKRIVLDGADDLIDALPATSQTVKGNGLRHPTPFIEPANVWATRESPSTDEAPLNSDCRASALPQPVYATSAARRCVPVHYRRAPVGRPARS